MSVYGRRSLTVPRRCAHAGSFDSRGLYLQRICERVTQPISLILPDLFQDRLAKLPEHEPHVGIIIGAIA